MTDRYLVVDVGWGWCALRRTSAGLCRSTVPRESRGEAAGAVAEGARYGEGDALLEQAAQALRRYFAGQATEFAVELDLGGLGDFTRRVLVACRQVAYGRTTSYGALAALAGSPRAARAVGQALHRNPLAVIVPCHRIVGSDGSLVGFGGGLEMKCRLLSLEAVGDSDAAAGRRCGLVGPQGPVKGSGC